MSAVVGQVFVGPLRAAKKESVCMYGSMSLTAAGLVDTVTTPSFSCDPGFTFTRASAGTYTIAFPACPGDAVLDLTRLALGTYPTAGQFFRVTAWSPTTGTMTLITSTTDGGAAADCNQLQMFHVKIVANVRAGN